MKKRGFFIFSIIALLPISRCTAYSGGSGTQGDPYRIADANNWQQLMNTSADWNKYFILTADVNLAEVSLTPVGNSTTNFTGVFDGNGHAIHNAVIDLPTSDNVGLFGYVNAGGQVIKNLGVERINVRGRNYVGGLVGGSHSVFNNEGSVISCYVTGSVSGNRFVGGLVGENFYYTVSNCYATVLVSGTGDRVGGLVGMNYIGQVTYCHAAGNVSGDRDVGGLVGQNHTGGVTSCYAACSTNGNYGVGGLVGDNGPDIGGIGIEAWITSCYATGAVRGLDYVGGLVGSNFYGSVSHCYSSGPIRGTGARVNCLVGYEDFGSIVTASYWDIDTSGCDWSYPYNGIGLTTAQMMQQASFTGWDFSDADGDPADWMMLREGEDYPRLAWQQIFPGDIAGLYGVNYVDLKELASHWLQSGCPTGCEDADIDSSGSVDFSDYAILAANWLKGLPGFPIGDFTGDFKVDYADLNELAAHWLSDCSLPFWCDGTDLNKNGRVSFRDFAIFAQHWLEGM